MLNEHHVVITPENVELRHEVAGVASRLTAAVVDYTILSAAQALLFAGLAYAATPVRDLARSLGWDARLAGNLLLAAGVLVVFSGWWGYFVMFELLWNGQTPGKRMLGLRVMGQRAQRVGGFASVVRNLLRPVDQFLLIGLVTMFIDRQSRRLGDFAAGTLVIRDPLLPARPAPHLEVPGRLAQWAGADAPEAARLAPADYALIREVLQRRERMVPAQADNLAGQVAHALAHRLGVAEPAATEAVAFLSRLAAAYEARSRYGAAGE